MGGLFAKYHCFWYCYFKRSFTVLTEPRVYENVTARSDKNSATPLPWLYNPVSGGTSGDRAGMTRPQKEIEGTQVLGLPRQQVWDRLCDLDLLAGRQYQGSFALIPAAADWRMVWNFWNVRMSFSKCSPYPYGRENRTLSLSLKRQSG